jgi:hypothetical protein
MANEHEDSEGQIEPLADPIEESRRVVEAAKEKGLMVRSIGGTAIWEHSETMHDEPFARNYRDVDFVTTREDKDAVIEFMTEMGYEQNERFNTMHRFQLEFQDPVNERKADYIVDKFRFCHSWSLRDRIEIDYPTVPIEDLLLSKVQIAEISDRDIRDIIAMFNDHPVGHDVETDAIDAGYISGLCQSDWGLYKTTTMNLDRVESYLSNNDLPINDARLSDRVDALREAIETEPKTIRWKLRSIVGERKQWYRRPELS